MVLLFLLLNVIVVDLVGYLNLINWVCEVLIFVSWYLKIVKCLKKIFWGS